MHGMHAQSWAVLALRGLTAVAFGLLALFLPGLSLLGFIALFAAFALFSGVVALIGAFRIRKRHEDWWLMLLLGLAGVGAGVVTIIHPALSTLILVLIIGANALVTGVLDIAAAIRLRKTIRDEWMLILSGIASIVFGVLVFLFPGAGALALIWLISLYAIVTGVLLLALAFRLRVHGRSPEIGRERRMLRDRRASVA